MGRVLETDVSYINYIKDIAEGQIEHMFMLAFSVTVRFRCPTSMFLFL